MFETIVLSKTSQSNWSVRARLFDGTILGVRGCSILGAKGKHGYFVNNKPTRGTGIGSVWDTYAKYWTELINHAKEYNA